MPNEIAAAAACEMLPNSGSTSLAIAGSPRKPMPRLASVMPNWHADRYWLRSSMRTSDRCAARLPSSPSSSRRVRRDRTSANSAATKKPLASTSRTTAIRKSAVTGRPVVNRYFEGDRRARARSGRRLAAQRANHASAAAAPILTVMRIVSLVPHATELLFALGLGDDVVGVTHECDHPEAVLELPHVTRNVLPAGLSAAQIDAAVRERTERGEAIYELDAERLRELEPDLIVTQALCPVCAVSYDDVDSVAQTLPGEPLVIALD